MFSIYNFDDDDDEEDMDRSRDGEGVSIKKKNKAYWDTGFKQAVLFGVYFGALNSFKNVWKLQYKI